MNKGFVCAILLLVPVLPARAQSGGCAAMVRNIYQRMAGERSSGATIRLRYTVRSTAKWQGKNRTSVSTVELIASDTRICMISPEVEVYQDAKTVVTVQPARRRIHIGLSDLARFRELRGSAVAAVRDSVLTTSTSDCSSVNDKSSGSDRKATFTLKPGPRARFQMESVAVFLNTERQTIQKLQFTPIPGASMTALELEFTTVDYNYSTDRFSHPLLEQFLDDSGHLTGKYKGYTLEDARNRVR